MMAGRGRGQAGQLGRRFDLGSFRRSHVARLSVFSIFAIHMALLHFFEIRNFLAVAVVESGGDVRNPP